MRIPSLPLTVALAAAVSLVAAPAASAQSQSPLPSPSAPRPRAPRSRRVPWHRASHRRRTRLLPRSPSPRRRACRRRPRRPSPAAATSPRRRVAGRATWPSPVVSSRSRATRVPHRWRSALTGSSSSRPRRSTCHRPCPARSGQQRTASRFKAAKLPGGKGSVIRSVVTMADGFVAVGFIPTPSTGLVWTSADGLTWKLVDKVPGAPSHAVAGPVRRPRRWWSPAADPRSIQASGH